MKNNKFVPVIFDQADRANIPLPLKPFTHYCIADDRGYLELYRRLTNQPFITIPELGKIESLPTRKRSLPIKPASDAQPTHFWNVPHARNEAFTGREEILGDLHADLKKKGEQALYGLGGVGKTQIAVEYAYRHREEYTAVLWTFADSEQSVRGGFSAIAKILDLPEKDSTEQAKVIDAVKRWLEQNEGWLLVLDNADYPALLKPFLPQQGKGQVLLTSRAYSFQALGVLSPHEINVLSKDEAREFFLRRTGKDASAKSSGADALAKELGYLPLALEQAAAYIVETGTSFETYLAGFKKQRLKLFEKQGPVLGNNAKEQQKRTVTTTWSLNFADVEKQSPASADLLRLSAFLAPDAIPLELLEQGKAELTEPLVAKLAEAADNPLVLEELLKPLLHFSLIRRNDEKQTYSIHPLVQEMIREGLSKEDQKAWAERAVRIVSASFPHVEFSSWPQCDRLLTHALSCAGLITLWDMEFAKAALLLNQAGYYLRERAEYVQANPLLQRALAIREKVLGPEHTATATSLNNLAELYRAQGRYNEAEPLYWRALAIYEKALGPEHPMTATSLNNLALLLINAQKKPADAEPLCRRALAIDEKALGVDHPDTAIDLNNLAALYRILGRYNEAEPLYLRALTIREKSLGPTHPDTALSLNNLALLYDAQDNYKQAEPLYLRALPIIEKAVGPDHPDTVIVRNNLIRFYRQQGRNAEADALEKSTKAEGT